MVDWSADGQIVASFGQDLIIWKRTDDVTMLFNVKSIKSLAFSPDGKILAIGCKINDYPGNYGFYCFLLLVIVLRFSLSPIFEIL